MEKRIKSLKILIIIQIVLGSLLTAWATLFAGVTTFISLQDNSISSILIAGGFTALAAIIFAIPYIIIPGFSIRELSRFTENRKTTVNYINAVLCIFIFFPIALCQIYLLIRLGSEKQSC